MNDIKPDLIMDNSNQISKETKTAISQPSFWERNRSFVAVAITSATMTVVFHIGYAFFTKIL